MNQEQRYRDTLARRFNEQGEGSADFSGPLAPGVGREALETAQKQGISDAQNRPIQPSSDGLNNGQYAQIAKDVVSSGSQPGSSAAGTVGQGMSTAGMMMMAGSKPSPASPYLLGGGLALQVLAQGEQNKRAQQNAQREAYNERIRARQEQMSKIASMGIQ